MQTDCIVVGSGIAGLSFALKVAARGGRVAIVTKKNRAESSTNYAQGGIACVTSQADGFELHVADTLTAGDGLCHEEVVRRIVEEGPARIRELVEVGVAFTQLDDGRISLGKEGGHSKRRILHVADLTGAAIEAALLRAVSEHPAITVHEHAFAIDLITRAKLEQRGLPMPHRENRVLGLYVLDVLSGKVQTWRASCVMLSTGGVGRVYQYTTNPDIATGDGIAMAYRAGVAVANLEFVQFHPTALYTNSDEPRRFLISEAVRGEGGILRNAHGEAFMERYDARRELAPRDIVARAIDAEMKQSGARHVWLDVSGFSEEEFAQRFPTIYQGCRSIGVAVPQEQIPVVPAAHYLCGGVVTNLDAETSLPGLYTCGEVACTGLHGANRLASNSLLEAVVMAQRGAESVTAYLHALGGNHGVSLPDWVDGDAQGRDERVVLAHNLDELRRTMWDYVGIVRTTKRLERARTRIATLMREINEYYWNFKVDLPLLELRNLVQVAELIVHCAMQRTESRGLHCTLDFPDRHAQAHDTTVVRREG